MSVAAQLSTLEQFDLHWQMTSCERFALAGLLQSLKPVCSLEIGTYQGGSLQVLSRFSESVMSVDIDPGVEERLAGKFRNVEYRCGDSAEVLDGVVKDINRQRREVGFVLIDGDHSAAGVRRDIEAVLKIEPMGRVVIIMHDSFNPDCREGMRMAQWASCPHVHFVELDFIPGVYHLEAYDTAAARTMWGGFACAVLEQEPRKGGVTVSESQRGLFESVYRDSAHAPKPRSGLPGRAWRRLKRTLAKR